MRNKMDTVLLSFIYSCKIFRVNITAVSLRPEKPFALPTARPAHRERNKNASDFISTFHSQTTIKSKIITSG